MKDRLTAKEAADFFGISKDTLRFYEKRGIIPAVPRDKNGYRVYSDYELNWIYLALNLKKTGLSLDQITEFAHLFKDPSPKSLTRQKEILSDQIKEVDHQIKMLEDTRKVLQYKLDIFDDHFAKLERGETDRNKVYPIWKKYHK